ncbi:hypothetical protein COTS27_00508 [Spirochaetota bacterium]|nr:hypothetical protein COTS27_00508 [Spirochaetota bacterium]
MNSILASIKNKSVLVTGGASGIGANIVTTLLDAGARVAFIDIDKKAAAALCTKLRKQLNTTPLFSYADLSKPEHIQKAVAEISHAQNGIQILINNVANDNRHSLTTLSPSKWDDLIAINLKSHVFITQQSLPAMKKNRSGSIINISSNSFMLGLHEMPAYTTAKAGLIGLTRTLSRELGSYNIRVNSILPGWVLTPKQRKLHFTPKAWQDCLAAQALKIKIQPQDIANTVLFLASDWSRAITGQSFVVDAGRILQ